MLTTTCFNWILSALGSRHSIDPYVQSTDKEAEVQGVFVQVLESGPTKEGALGKGTSSHGVGGASPNTHPAGPGEHGVFLPVRGQLGHSGKGIGLRGPSLGRKGEAGRRKMTKAQDLLVND